MYTIFGRIRASLVVMAAAFGSGPAWSDVVKPGEEGELLNFLPALDGRHVCFARTYSADHLAQHPKQKVTEIQFRLAYHRFEPDGFFAEGQRNYYFQVRAKLRDRDRFLSTIGECSPAGNEISCGVDCDGGGVVVKRTGKPGQILVSLDEYGYLRLSSGCGGGDEGGGLDLEPGEDDHNFLLTETGAQSCPHYDNW